MASIRTVCVHRHYTGHFKSVVTKPQNVFVMRDVSCGGYVAGGNCDWFAPDGLVATAKDTIMQRLSFANDTAERYPSMLAFPIPANDVSTGKLSTVMSVTSRLLPWEVMSNGGSTHESFPGGQDAYSAYSQALDLGQIHYGEVSCVLLDPSPLSS